jgi:hypothetical protein
MLRLLLLTAVVKLPVDDVKVMVIQLDLAAFASLHLGNKDPSVK